MQHTKIRFKVEFEATVVVDEFPVQAQAKILHDLKDYFSNKNAERLKNIGVLPSIRCNPNIQSKIDIVDYTHFVGTHLIAITDKFVIHLMDKAFEDEEPCLIVDPEVNDTHVKFMSFEKDERYNCDRVKLILIDKKPYVKYKDDFKLVRKLKVKE